MADYRNKYTLTISVEIGTNKKLTPEEVAKAIRDNWNFTPGVDHMADFHNPDKDFSIKYHSFAVQVFPKFDKAVVKKAFPAKTKKRG